MLRSQHSKTMPKNKVFHELRQELECVVPFATPQNNTLSHRPALVSKVGMVAREILHSSANDPHSMASKLHKVAQRATKAWRAGRAADRRAFEAANADDGDDKQAPQ